jgi:hypothetical protein
MLKPSDLRRRALRRLALNRRALIQEASKSRVRPSLSQDRKTPYKSLILVKLLAEASAISFNLTRCLCLHSCLIERTDPNANPNGRLASRVSIDTSASLVNSTEGVGSRGHRLRLPFLPNMANSRLHQLAGLLDQLKRTRDPRSDCGMDVVWILNRAKFGHTATCARPSSKNSARSVRAASSGTADSNSLRRCAVGAIEADQVAGLLLRVPAGLMDVVGETFVAGSEEQSIGGADYPDCVAVIGAVIFRENILWFDIDDERESSG